LTPEQSVKAVELCKKYGFKVGGTFIIGSPDETKEEMMETLEFAKKLDLNKFGAYILVPYPGTPVWKSALEKGKVSEDMDFSLLKKDEDFSIENYFDSIENEFIALGRKVEIYKKEKKGQSQVESAFLKDNTEIYNIQFQTETSIKIKLEVDKDPPLFFQTEHKLLLLPFSFMTRCLTLSGLSAGKMHAFLFRKCRNSTGKNKCIISSWYPDS